MKSAFLSYLWQKLIPSGWLSKRGWRSALACMCWRESSKRGENIALDYLVDRSR